ncbi:hypothetical protein CTI12_AA191170 [Artemisia annua]|uniref:Uncharacterized protein n=1 Tax=Artemisia annua TaxID=35608 RepID=A0A2U1P5N7_ARTAN|nr:hypothetical protein CTI12_AA191170 [Artemisia annua]
MIHRVDETVLVEEELLIVTRLLPLHFLKEDYLKSGTIFGHDTKKYDIELKSVFSASQLRPFVLISFRSLLMFYLPLLESNLNDFANVSLYDLVDEHQGCGLCCTSQDGRQILGYAASWLVQVGIECYRYVRDISKSNQVDDINVDAKRKEEAKLPRQRVYYVTVWCCSSLVSASIGSGITATLFRPSFGQFIRQILGYAASWLVQVGIECYRYVRDISKSNQVDDINVDAKHKEEAKLPRQRVYYVTVWCCSSLVSASIGSGITATLFRPSFGQFISKNHTTTQLVKHG